MDNNNNAIRYISGMYNRDFRNNAIRGPRRYEKILKRPNTHLRRVTRARRMIKGQEMAI